MRRDEIERLAALLHAWEAYTVEKNKLQSVWEKTPFPLEDFLAR